MSSQEQAQPSGTGLWLDTPADFEAVARDVQEGRRGETTGRLDRGGTRPRAGDVYVVREGRGGIQRWTDGLKWGPSSTRHQNSITYYPPPVTTGHSAAICIRKQRYVVEMRDYSGQEMRWLVVSYVWHDDATNRCTLHRPTHSPMCDLTSDMTVLATTISATPHYLTYSVPRSPVTIMHASTYIPIVSSPSFSVVPSPASCSLATPIPPTSAQHSSPVTLVLPFKLNIPGGIPLPRLPELDQRVGL
ncbi:hypothetical protein BKA62DRAFT_704511 [Auriculariales sp. MPI-PUGE-AT-0066]|nr:hypothetical protein BKA62DRAFT_704511 [Auriculariales sp. MPI-PUGE-AT-0066]